MSSLRDLDPDALGKLKEHESALEDDEDTVQVPVAEIARLGELERKKKELERQLAAANRKLQKTSTETAAARVAAQCVTTKIGGYDGIPPSSLDVKIEVDEQGRQIAWIPCIVWPHPKQDENRPFYEYPDRNDPSGETKIRIPNIHCGKTQISESLRTVILTNPVNNQPAEFGIRGFATLAVVVGKRPEDIHESISRRDQRTNLMATIPDITATDQKPGAHEEEKPPFIPSETSTPANKQEKNASSENISTSL